MRVRRSVLETAPGGTVARVQFHLREFRQESLAADGPEFVGGPNLVRLVERADVQLHLIARAGKDRRPAARAEETPLVFAGVALDLDGVLREDCRGIR